MYLRVESRESSPTCVNKLAPLRKYSPDLRETNFVWKSNDWAFSCSTNEDIVSFCIQILKGRIIEVGDRYFRAIPSSLAVFCMLDMVFCWHIALIRILHLLEISVTVQLYVLHVSLREHMAAQTLTKVKMSTLSVNVLLMLYSLSAISQL